jgi:uncharacterized circularly permuted ATP-grasp superfamily protein
MTIADHRVNARARSAVWRELVDADGQPRPAATALLEHLRGLGLSELQARQDAADLEILAMGVTFTVYADGRGSDRAWPFDVIPGSSTRRSGAPSSAGSASA